jgi:hypothetical protein
MSLSIDQVHRIKAMKHDDLVAGAQTEDLAVVVEASLRLHNATRLLNGVLIALTLVLVALTAALVWFTATKGG